MAQNLRDNSKQTQAYQHETETRTNIPTPGLAPDGEIAEVPRMTYYYNPHLQPILRSADNDSLPSHVESLLKKAQKDPLTADEVQQLSNTIHSQPWLEWANKREEGDSFTVDPVPLFIHEKLSTQAILETAKRNDIQRSLFDNPQQKYQDAVQFYEHEVPWSNRLILGDSLQVMDSLANREGLIGQAQMIYIDPPYRINYRSNFQPDVFRTNFPDSDKHLSREIEQIKAYRDTWKLGSHSYLSYLRKRFVISKDLLKDSGSIFVQISVKNVHHVRCLLDEIFRQENFVAEIVLRTRSTSTSKYLSTLNDFILWYAKDIKLLKFHHLYIDKEIEGRFTKVELPTGEVVSASSKKSIENGKFFTSSSLFSTSGNDETAKSFLFRNKTYKPKPSRGWRCSIEGLEKLAKAERIIPHDTNVGYKYYFSDYPFTELTNFWSEQLSEVNKVYAVQTNETAIQRCMLMSTEPGDLVIDPTCGGGTTAYVAEKWGRRWITIDTSRIAITVARTRLLTAIYDYYKLKDEADIGKGFVLETAPHIQLKDITNNVALDSIFGEYEPVLQEKLSELNQALRQVTPEIRNELQQKLATKNRNEITDADQRRWNLPETRWEEWEVPFDTDPVWPQSLQEALITYRKVWREKMDAVDLCIAESAIQRNLVDRPVVEKNLIRVSGRFTVESVQPPAVSLDEVEAHNGLDTEPANGAAYIEQMFSLLKTNGVGSGNQRKEFTKLDRLDGGLFHAEGQFKDDEQEVGIVFGPQHGPITALLVENCLREARRLYDMLLFVGFHSEPEAQAIIQDKHRHLQTHYIQIPPDVAMNDLLRSTHADKLFTIIGSPRIKLGKIDDGQFKVIMEGVDTYNPVDNTIEPTRADQVAAWFVDADYDGRTFRPTHTFFPNKGTWKNIAKSLKSMINEDFLETFSGTESPPFSIGEHKCVAVKVIDRRGNELMRIHKLGERDG